MNLNELLNEQTYGPLEEGVYTVTTKIIGLVDTKAATQFLQINHTLENNRVVMHNIFESNIPALRSQLRRVFNIPTDTQMSFMELLNQFCKGTHNIYVSKNGEYTNINFLPPLKVQSSANDDVWA